VKKLLSGVIAVSLLAGTALAQAGPTTAANPLLAEWTGPQGGVPPFDKVRIADFKPALEAAMAANLKEIQAVASNPAKPTFANVILPMEQAGHQLSRVNAVYGVWSGNVSTPEYQKVEAEMAPKLSAFQDSITQNAQLFARVDAVYNSPDKAKLTPEEQRLVWVYWNNFVQQGARLNAADKAALSQINQKLAGLYTQFSQNELSDEETYALVLDSQAQLAGLPQGLIDSAAAEAAHRKMPGKWVIANTRSAMEPFLVSSSDRALREKGWRMWIMRGDNGGAKDNNAIVTQILALRAQKAKLLGYPTYAHWHLADTMAKTPDKAMALMMSVWTPAVAQVHKDVAEMQAIVDAEKSGFKIQPWDYRYYAEKVRKAKYDLDMSAVKPYLQLDHVRDAMFWAAGQLYGFTFTPVTNVPLFNPDMQVFAVQAAGGAPVGMIYIDPFARAGKNSGAWMNEYRTQSGLDRATPIVSNNYNFAKASPGQPTLLSWDDATTMFHEFGHALHGLSSKVTYPSVAGTNVARDYVEFPSQFNEHFLTTPGVLRFLVNAQGQAIPPELVAKIHRAHNFGEGFSTVETQASAIMDMKLHLAGATPIDPRAFEKATLAELGMPSEIVMRHRIPQFGHVFSGEGYAAGYYGYLWAEVIDQDAFEAFTEAGDPFDKATAKRFHDDILSVGNTIDPAIAFRNFRGRDPKAEALLRDHGFPIAGGPAGGSK
jgi:peptidyl-dipeptidase Dcp